MYKNSGFGISSFGLKIIALAFMILDHVHTYLQFGPSWFGVITRFVAPLFVYFLVEGHHYTKDKKKYVLRLALFALIVSVGNIAINLYFNHIDLVNISYFNLFQGNNILKTLTVFMLILMLLDIKNLSASKIIFKYLGLVVLSIYSVAFCEGGLYLLPLLYLFYFAYGNKKKICIGIAVWSLLFLVKAIFNYVSGNTGVSLYQSLCFNAEWGMMLTILPIMFYNGKRGYTGTFAKWMFYIAYPLHLWILMILSNVLAIR